MPTNLPILVPAAGCDCSSCPFWMENPNAVEPVCSGKSDSCAWHTCAIREATTQRPFDSSPCRTCAVRCGSRDDIFAWMHGVGGTVLFDDVTPSPEPLPFATQFVPLLDDTSQSSPHRQLDWEVYGVPMRRVMSRVLGEPGEPLHPQGRWEERGAHDVLGLGPDQKAVLMGYSPDALLERMWERRHADKLLDRIAQMGFDLVTSPDFSVYGDQPRFEHLFNMRRAMVFTQELVDRGVNAIPSVYWFRLEDLDRWLQWVEETEPSAICLPRHTSRHQGEWDLLAAPGLEYLGRQLDQLSANTKVLVTGVVNRDRVTQLGNWFGTRLIIASQQPVHLAAQGRRVTDEGREVYQAHRADLFSYNVQFYNRRVQQATSPTKA